jgi:hypothetical protein
MEIEEYQKKGGMEINSSRVMKRISNLELDTANLKDDISR